MRWRSRVHPRSRGAARHLSYATLGTMGPSPLTRGSLDRRLTDTARTGSIPAHAGQPCTCAWTPAPAWVHPRSRGAAKLRRHCARRTNGPSPLTRGSRGRLSSQAGGRGSIPAHAGQPTSVGLAVRISRVHPRSRGAAFVTGFSKTSTSGPSPLTRGSPDRADKSARRQGSIPAHAGQPPRRPRTGGTGGVHPRSRGAASALDCLAVKSKGPSPLTRGSRATHPSHALRHGSIPAHAGQPLPPGAPACSAWVHPRSRGAAANCRAPKYRRAGPSPLTRGSPAPGCCRCGEPGSIPAHAGQPCSYTARARGSRVHPRSRGAAPAPRSLSTSPRGPSPLTRGSHQVPVIHPADQGSIPAHAGQPSLDDWTAMQPGVHPRSRGAAAKTPK